MTSPHRENFKNSEENIFMQLSKVNQKGIHHLAKKIAVLGITPVQAITLNIIVSREEMNACELRRRIGLDSATMTGILDRLEFAKLVNRKNDPLDRRKIRVGLTPKGWNIGNEAAVLIQEAHHEFIKILTYREKQDLMRLISKLRQ